MGEVRSASVVSGVKPRDVDAHIAALSKGRDVLSVSVAPLTRTGWGSEVGRGTLESATFTYAVLITVVWFDPTG